MRTHNVFVAIAYSSAEKYTRIVEQSSADGPSDEIVHDVERLKLPQPDSIIVKGHEQVHLSWEMGAVGYNEFCNSLHNVLQEISNVKSDLLHELTIDKVIILGDSPEDQSPNEPTGTHSGATQTNPTGRQSEKRPRISEQDAIQDDAKRPMKRACGFSEPDKSKKGSNRGRKETTHLLVGDVRPSKQHSCPTPGCQKVFDRPGKLKEHLSQKKCGPVSKAKKKSVSTGKSSAPAKQIQKPIPTPDPNAQLTFKYYHSYPPLAGRPYVCVPYAFQAYAAPPIFVNPLIAPQPNSSAINNAPTQLPHSLIAPEGSKISSASTTRSAPVSQETITLESSGSRCEDAGPNQATFNRPERGTTLHETVVNEQEVPSGCQECNSLSSGTARGNSPVSEHPGISNSQDHVECGDEPERVFTADLEAHHASDGSPNEILLATSTVSTETQTGEKDIGNSADNQTPDGSSNEISDGQLATSTASTCNVTDDKNSGIDNANSQHEPKDATDATKDCQIFEDVELQMVASVVQAARAKIRDRLVREIQDAKRASAAEVEVATKQRLTAEGEAQREREKRIDIDTRRMHVEEALASTQRILDSERAAHAEAESKLRGCQSDLCLATERLRMVENEVTKERNERVLLEQKLKDVERTNLETERSLALERHNLELMRTKEVIQSDKIIAAVLLAALAHENRRIAGGKIEAETRHRLDTERRRTEAETELAEAKLKIEADRDVRSRLNADWVAAQSAVAQAIAAQTKIKEEFEQERRARCAAEKLEEIARDRIADMERSLESERESRINMESKLKEEGFAKAEMVERFQKAKQDIALEHDGRLKAQERLRSVGLAFENLNRTCEFQQDALRDVNQTLEKERGCLKLVMDNLEKAKSEIQRERDSKFMAEDRLQQIERALMRAEGQYAAEKEAHYKADATVEEEKIAAAAEKTRRLAAERETTKEQAARYSAEAQLQRVAEKLADAKDQLVMEHNNFTEAKKTIGEMEFTLAKVRKTVADVEESLLREMDLRTAAEHREAIVQNLLVQEAANRQKAETALADIRIECKDPFIDALMVVESEHERRKLFFTTLTKGQASMPTQKVSSPEGCSSGEPAEPHSEASQSGATGKQASKRAKKRSRKNEQEVIDDDAEPSMKRACGSSDQLKNGPSGGKKGTTRYLVGDGRQSKKHPCPTPDCHKVFDRPHRLKKHLSQGKCGPAGTARKQTVSIGKSAAAAGPTQKSISIPNPDSQLTCKFQSYPGSSATPSYVYMPYAFHAYAAPPIFFNPLTAPQPSPSAIIDVPTQPSHSLMVPEESETSSGSTVQSTSVSQETIAIDSYLEDAGPNHDEDDQRGTTPLDQATDETVGLNEHVRSGRNSSPESKQDTPSVPQQPDVSNSHDAVERSEEGIPTENREHLASDASASETSDTLLATSTASNHIATDDQESGGNNCDSQCQTRDATDVAKECQTLGNGDQLQFIVSVLQSALAKTRVQLDRESDRSANIEDAKRASAAEVEAANKRLHAAEEEVQREREMRIEIDTRRMQAEETMTSIQRNLDSEMAARAAAESTLQSHLSDLCLTTARLQTAESEVTKERDEKMLLEQKLQDLQSRMVETEQSLAVERDSSERMRTEEAIQRDKLTAAVLLASLTHENRRAVEENLEIEQKLRLDMEHHVNETEKELADAKRKIEADCEIRSRLNADLVAAQSAVTRAVAAQTKVEEELEQERNARSATEKLVETTRDAVADLERNIESERESRLTMESKLKEKDVAMTAMVERFENAKREIALEHDEQLKAEERLKCMEAAFEKLNRNWEVQQDALRDVNQTLEKERGSLNLANDKLIEAEAEIQRERASKLLAEDRLQRVEQALKRAEGQYAAEKEAHYTTDAALIVEQIAVADEKTRRLAAERKTAKEIAAKLGAEAQLQQLSKQLDDMKDQLATEHDKLARARETTREMVSTLAQNRKMVDDAGKSLLGEKHLRAAAERHQVIVQEKLIQESANRRKAENALADMRNELLLYDHDKPPGTVTVDDVISDVGEIGFKAPMKDHIRITPEGQVHLWWITTNDEHKTFCDTLQQKFRDFQRRKARNEIRESLDVRDFNIPDWGFNPREVHNQAPLPDQANKDQNIPVSIGRRSSESCPVDDDSDTPRKRKKRSKSIKKTTGDGPTPVSEAWKDDESDAPRKRKKRSGPVKKKTTGDGATPASEASKDPSSSHSNHSPSDPETENNCLNDPPPSAVSNPREGTLVAIEPILGKESLQREPETSTRSETVGYGILAGDGKATCNGISDLLVPPEAEERIPISQLQNAHPTSPVPCEGNAVVMDHDTDQGHRLYLQDMDTSLDTVLRVVHDCIVRELNDLKDARRAAESAKTLASEKCRIAQDEVDQERVRRCDAEKERRAVQELLDESEHVLESEREAHAGTKITLQTEQSKLAAANEGRQAAELDRNEANERFNGLTLAYADAHCQLRRERSLRCDVTHRLNISEMALAEAKRQFSTQKDKETLLYEQLAFEQSELSDASEERKKIQEALNCEREERLKAEERYATAQETLCDSQRRLNDEVNVCQQKEAMLQEELVVKAALIEHHRVTETELVAEREKIQMALNCEKEERLKAQERHATAQETLCDTRRRLNDEENVRRQKEALLEEELVVKAALIEHHRVTEAELVVERQARAKAEQARHGVEEQLARCQVAERTASTKIQELLDEQRATAVELNEQKQMAEETLKQERDRRIEAEEQLQRALEALNLAKDEVATESAAREQADAVLSAERDKLRSSDDELTRERSARVEAERRLQEALDKVANAECQAAKERMEHAKLEDALRITVQQAKSAATIKHAEGDRSEHDLQSKAKNDSEEGSLKELLASEREKRRTAETMLASVRRECSAPFLVPALLDIFLNLVATADGSPA
ncbi:hypothetical protein BD410DRAFT_823802 [Rickenella mellea]|uniref:Uncharacterized protein n=1 Tax=Rickenella mellea TaxID=50990 RepID=A0A4R5XHN6_9AGAM|nr:hypothetical protein BD410DRAFT_823802 [Rickenella mellea]